MTGVAAIDWHPAGGDVFVNGQYMSRLPDHPRHVRLVSFALALPRRDTVLLLGLGGGGMVRELAQDPGTRRLEVVDWSYELPRLLDGPRARRLLDDALRRPHVTVRRCDARVAVGLYEPASFDVVIDNLTIGHWVGATSVKSIQYFRQVHRDPEAGRGVRLPRQLGGRETGHPRRPDRGPSATCTSIPARKRWTRWCSRPTAPWTSMRRTSRRCSSGCA